MHRQAPTSSADPLAPFAGVGHWLTAAVLLTAAGLALGTIAAQLLRSRALHWSWSAAALLAAAVL
ncbi:MAG TPA: hypothetical protein VH025_07815, partial [Solirubrobacteraceae bacterium]|nr:hypothetical protein [Solirubrobacteraceae bacterium]